MCSPPKTCLLKEDFSLGCGTLNYVTDRELNSRCPNTLRLLSHPKLADCECCALFCSDWINDTVFFLSFQLYKELCLSTGNPMEGVGREVLVKLPLPSLDNTKSTLLQGVIREIGQ